MFLRIFFLIYSVSLNAMVMENEFQHPDKRLRRNSSANDIERLRAQEAAKQADKQKDLEKNTLVRSASQAVVNDNFYGSPATSKRLLLWKEFRNRNNNPAKKIFKAVCDRDLKLLSQELAKLHKNKTPFCSIKDEHGKTILYNFCAILAKDGSGKYQESDKLIVGLLLTSYRQDFLMMIKEEGDQCLEVLKNSPHSDKEYLSGHINFFTQINSLSSPNKPGKKIKDCIQTDSNS